MKGLTKELFGEFLGTAILVFIGCGSVAVAVLFGTLGSLLEVAIVWGIGISLAIFASRTWCPAHLNPAVSLAMALYGNFSWKKFPSYAGAQTLGAFTAGIILYLILCTHFANFEAEHQIIRGSVTSIQTAQCFGEFFPNPGYSQLVISTSMACIWEAFGTCLLVVGIFAICHFERILGNLAPLLIGACVTGIICLVAPYTQAGLNPARDFGPRMAAYFMGWNTAAFPKPTSSFFTVYIIGPLFGATLGAFLYKGLIKQLKNG